MKYIAGLSMVASAILSCANSRGQISSVGPKKLSILSPPIVVGVSNVQSGPSQSLGQNLLRGSLAYFELSNERGGIYGRKISILLKDDKYEPDPAVQNTNELIGKDKAFFRFGYVGTPTLTRTLPLLKYYEKESIVNVAPFTGADAQRKPPYDSRPACRIRLSIKHKKVHPSDPGTFRLFLLHILGGACSVKS